MDPLQVLLMKEGRRKPRIESLFEDRMTEEQSDKLEDLILTWYEYEAAYRPALGAPRVSPSARQYRSSEVHDDRDEAEARYRKSVAESVSACIDELPVMQRVAIQLHCYAKQSGASVIKSPRMTLEERHANYQMAKLAIWGMPRMREWLR